MQENRAMVIMIPCADLDLAQKKIPGPKSIDPGISLFYPKTDKRPYSR